MWRIVIRFAVVSALACYTSAAGAQSGGPYDLTWSTIDLDGVALAAIQGLYQMAQEKDALIAKLQEQNAALEARLSALERAAQRGPR